MPATCSAVKCHNRWSKENNRSFYKFPTSDVELRKKWVANMKRDAWTPTKHSYLCSDHFVEKLFRYNNERRSLMPNAVPTIFKFPHTTTSLSPAEKAKEESQSGSVVDVCINYLCSLSSSERSAETLSASEDIPASCCNIEDTSTAGNVETTPVSHDVEPSSQSPSSIQPSPAPLHIRLSSLSHDHSYAPSSVRMKKLYEDRTNECVRLRQGLRVARQDAARQRDKCDKLKKATFELNRRLNEAMLQISAASEMQVDGLLKELLDCHCTGAKSHQYPESVKTFARTLKGYSLRAYKHVGKVIRLPHPRTLRHWAAIGEKQSGVTEETTGSSTVS